MNVKAIQEKYNLFRDAGGDHNQFIDANVLTSKQAHELTAYYVTTLGKPKSPEYENRVLECRESLWQYSKRTCLTYPLGDPRAPRFVENSYLHVVPRPSIAMTFLS